jgi:hypothetical protein
MVEDYFVGAGTIMGRWEMEEKTLPSYLQK